MNSNSNYSPFVEHSFRRLTLLIHQQDVLDPSNDKTPAQSFQTSSLASNDLVSFASKAKSQRQAIHRVSSDTTEVKTKIEPLPLSHRAYMRPPKNRTTSFPHRCSSSRLSDRSETSFNNQSFESVGSPSTTKQQSNELPVQRHSEQTLYDIRFERDRQNDVRRQYNIPSPFQRQWLRQPRYIPQERPNYGRMQQSSNE